MVLYFSFNTFIEFLNLSLQMTDHASQAGCITLVMMFHYFNITNFFWMFVEGKFLLCQSFKCIYNTWAEKSLAGYRGGWMLFPRIPFMYFFHIVYKNISEMLYSNRQYTAYCPYLSSCVRGIREAFENSAIFCPAIDKDKA